MYQDQKTQRDRVVSEAMSWRGTRYQKGQELKGVYADCATFINGVFGACGLFHDDELSTMVYSASGHNARNEELYMLRLLRHAHELIELHAGEVPDPQPGDIVAVRAGRVFNHGAIVVEWPRVIHCLDDCSNGGVQLAQADMHPMFIGFERKFFSVWHA